MEESKYNNFQTFLTETHQAIFLKLRFLIPLLPCVITAIHFSKAQHMVVVWHMLPAFFWGLLALQFSASRKGIFNLDSSSFTQIYIFLFAYGVMSSAALVMVKELFEIRNGPAQIIMAVAAIAVWDKNYGVLLARSFTLGLFMVATTYYFDHSFAELTMQHAITGFVYAALIAKLIQSILRRNFELESQIYHKQILITQSASKSLFPHQIAMIQQGASLEETIDVSERKAFLVELDIKKSTSIKGELYEQAKKHCFSQIQQQLIYQNYLLNPVTPCRPYSNAYKLKELGDGFLISIGHPFEIPLHTSAAETLALICLESINLAKASFQEVMHIDVNIAITVTASNIKPFWTASPGSQLDFEQYGLTKVCRLSEFRRVLERETIMEDMTDTILTDYESYIALRDHVPDLERIDLFEKNLSLRGYPNDGVVYFHTARQKIRAKSVV